MAMEVVMPRGLSYSVYERRTQVLKARLRELSSFEIENLAAEALALRVKSARERRPHRSFIQAVNEAIYGRHDDFRWNLEYQPKSLKRKAAR